MTVQIIIEPPHDKTNKMTVRPAKPQISLGIRPVWSVLAVRSMGNFLHADSEDSDQTGHPGLIWGFAGHTCHFVCFVMRRLNYYTCTFLSIKFSMAYYSRYFTAIQTCYGFGMVSYDVVMESTVLHPRSDSRNWPRSSECSWPISVDLIHTCITSGAHEFVF